ncbi:hypothetical protein GF312_10230 [Candidatus Poribacteria bacterium]|nr:hypothetical protein [Candidatus Poribacteria bacterium]
MRFKTTLLAICVLALAFSGTAMAGHGELEGWWDVTVHWADGETQTDKWDISMDTGFIGGAESWETDSAGILYFLLRHVSIRVEVDGEGLCSFMGIKIGSMMFGTMFDLDEPYERGTWYASPGEEPI